MGGKGGCRFIKDEHAWFAVECLGNLYHLPASQGELPDGSFQPFGQSDPIADGLSPARQFGIIDEPGPPRIGTQPDIFGDGEVARQTQLLLHYGYPSSPGLRGREVRDRVAVNLDRATVRSE